MKNCSVCQAEVPEEAKFCPECGASMVSEPETVKEEGEEIVSLETDPEAPAVMRWYYVEDGRSMGPFDQKELFEKLTQKVITPETYVWSKGMKEWTQLHNTKVYQEQAGVFEIPVLEEDGQPIETFQELDLHKDPIEPVLEEPKKEVKTPPFHKEPENETQDWYYVVNGRTVGPFSETVMVHNIHQGVVDGNTYVWKEGYLDWQHLKDTPLAIHLSKATRPNETVLPGQAPYYANYQPGVPIRNIILYLLLTVVTCGIFEFVWLYMVASDLNKFNAQKGKKPIAEPLLVVVFSLITCGIYTVYYFWKAGNEVYELSDHRLSNTSTLLAILSLFVQPASLAILQDQINALVESGEFH